jgi:N-carbamoylputrescine amidase
MYFAALSERRRFTEVNKLMSSNGGFGISCLQTLPIFGAVSENVADLERRVTEAAAVGAQVIVAPELCTTGYVFQSREEAFELSEAIDGQTIERFREVAMRLGIYFTFGFAEREGDRLFNSSVLLGPNGLIGRYRKLHLWDEEAQFFEPGNLGVPIFHTPLGRIALLICYDIWFPEAWRLASLGGADVVCVSTNWVPVPGQRDDRPPMANLLCMTSAHQNGIWVAAANRIGIERGQPFLGRSINVEPSGWPQGEVASSDQPDTLHGRVDVAAARRGRSWGRFNHLLRDRRTDVYENGSPR